MPSHGTTLSLHHEIALMSAPRADLLTAEQAGQLHLELLAGHEPPADLPRSITHVLVIADTGCATTIGNSPDQFKPGSIVESKTDVIGAFGPGTCNKRGHFRFPMETESHGIRKFEESNSILNDKCPYVLLALGRASIEQGVSLYMPRHWAD